MRHQGLPSSLNSIDFLNENRVELTQIYGETSNPTRIENRNLSKAV